MAPPPKGGSGNLMAQPQVTELYPRWFCSASFIRLLLMYAGASEEKEDEQESEQELITEHDDGLQE